MKDFEVDFDFTEERGDTDYENRIVTPSYEAGDEAEVSLRPRRMEEYIGQDKAKENLKVYIEAARMRGDSLDHVLLYGPPEAVFRLQPVEHSIVHGSVEDRVARAPVLGLVHGGVGVAEQALGIGIRHGAGDADRGRDRPPGGGHRTRGRRAAPERRVRHASRGRSPPAGVG